MRWCRCLLGLLLAAVLAPAMADASAGPDLVARFKVSWTPKGQPVQTQHWQLSRSSTEITWIKGNDLTDIWRRDASGIRLERVLRADQHVIEYSAGELRTLQVLLDWRNLGSLLAESDLARLQPVGKPAAKHHPGQPQHWRGVLAGEQVDLLWDPVARLPLRLVRSGKSGQVVFQRLAMHAVAPADWPRADAGTENFQRLDAADFGDMDYNPVVRREQARDERAGWRQPHSH